MAPAGGEDLERHGAVSVEKPAGILHFLRFHGPDDGDPSGATKFIGKNIENPVAELGLPGKAAATPAPKFGHACGNASPRKVWHDRSRPGMIYLLFKSLM